MEPDTDTLLLAANAGDWSGRSALLRAGYATWAGGRIKLTPKGIRRVLEIKRSRQT